MYHEFNSLSPLQHATFSPWRRCGFAIWRTERMVAYGLLVNGVEYAMGLQVPFFEAWRTVLPPDVRAGVERECERKKVELGG